MRRQPEVPRWRRSRYQPQPQVIKLSGRAARRYARQAYAQPQPAPAVQGSAAHIPVPGAALAARTGGFRFRRHLVPFAWLAVLLGAGLGIHRSGSLREGIITGLVLGFLIAACSWRMAGWTRNACAAASVLTAAFVPLLAAIGWNAPVPPVVIAGWLAVAVPWLHRYRWRPGTPEPVVADDQRKWDMYMAAKKARDTWLADRRELPARGRQWTIMLPAGELTPASIMSLHAVIAGVWDSPLTEVFPEPYPDGRQSRALLTILERDTLAATAEWDGTGADLATGCASIGRFADGQQARVRFLVPRDGVRHGLVAGVTGAGKTYVLDLLVRLALTCGFVPVILDPQEGQSLPYWRDKVLYFGGVTECMTGLRGLQAGMLDRSRYLAGLEWDDHGHRVTGMDFYDHDLCGLPPVLIIADELPVLLTDKACGADAIRLAADIGKRGRKTGVALWPVAQVPSLAELGDQVVRSMLRGGNIICLRTGDSVSAGYLGLQADPSALPPYFADGTPTAGLGYLLGPDQRQAPFRSYLVPSRLRHARVTVPPLDARFAECIARVIREDEKSREAPAAAPAVTVPEPDDSAPEGRTAADAVLAVLVRRMDRGEILKAAGDLVTKEWGRDRAFTMRAVGAALEKLAKEKRIRKQGRNVYEPAPVSGTEGQG